MAAESSGTLARGRQPRFFGVVGRALVVARPFSRASAPRHGLHRHRRRCGGRAATARAAAAAAATVAASAAAAVAEAAVAAEAVAEAGGATAAVAGHGWAYRGV